MLSETVFRSPYSLGVQSAVAWRSCPSPCFQLPLSDLLLQPILAIPVPTAIGLPTGHEAPSDRSTPTRSGPSSLPSQRLHFQNLRSRPMSPSLYPFFPLPPHSHGSGPRSAPSLPNLSGGSRAVLACLSSKNCDDDLVVSSESLFLDRTCRWGSLGSLVTSGENFSRNSVSPHRGPLSRAYSVSVPQ